MIHIFNRVSSRMATVSVALDAGARSEGDTFSLGLAHMMEHMCFKGTKTRNWQEINRQIAFIGGHANAYTSHELVCYYVSVPVENLESAIEILADQVFNSTLPEEEFIKEWEVVKQEEIGQADDPTNGLFKELGERVMPGRLANPIIGTKESIEGFSIEELRKFYKQIYKPSNMIVSLAANCSKRDAKKMLVKYFGKQTKFALSAPVYKPVEIKSNRVVVNKDGLEHVYACVCMPGINISDSRDNALGIAEHILGGGMDSRLFEEIREKLGLVYAISTSSTSYREAGYVLIYFQTEEDKVEQVIEVINQELNKITTEEITEEELIRAKNSIKSMVYSMQDSTMGMAQDSLRRSMFNQPSLKMDMEEFDKVTIADVLSVAKAMFTSDKQLVIICKDDQTI